MKISKFNQLHLRNDAHFQFHTEFKDLVEKHGPEALKIESLFSYYLPLLEREGEALKKINKSALTEKIHEADKGRNETFIGMTEVNKGMCRHYSKPVAEASRKIKIVLDAYGNLAKKTLNEETSAIYNLLQDLRSDKYAPDAAKSEIMGWANELERRNQKMEALIKDRFDEAAEKCDIVLKTARAELDKSYHGISKRIDALIIVEGVADYEAFARTLNAIIAKYAVKRHRRASPFDSDHEVPLSIARRAGFDRPLAEAEATEGEATEGEASEAEELE